MWLAFFVLFSHTNRAIIGGSVCSDS